MREPIRLYQTDLQGIGRFYDLPWSEARFDRLERLHREWKTRLEAVDFDKLDSPGRIDFLLLRNRLEGELNESARQRVRLAEMEALLPFRRPLQALEVARWRMAPVESQADASLLGAVPEQLKKLQKALEQGKKPKPPEKPGAAEEAAGSPAGAEAASGEPAPLKVSPVVANRAAGAAEDVRGTLRTWYSSYDGFQPDFSWWLKRPYEEASKALEDYAKFLREEIAGVKGKDEDPLIGEPIGAEALADQLRREMIAYTPEELIALGEAEFSWCEAEMKKAAAEMGCGTNWPAALAKVKADYVPPGQQDGLVAACGREAIQYVREQDLVTVPALCEELWRLTMISPEGQKTLPFAAYGGQSVMVAYAKEDMKHEDKVMAMRGNNRHFTRIVVAHELIPGHHLQSFMAARGQAYRGIFSTPFLVEGWAVYWELLLWDRGYARSAEDRMGMLFWRMHRCARIIVSLKFQLGRMKPAEMVDFLVQRVGHERFGATSEVRRFIGGGYSPLYQCGYLVGALQLRALRQELVGAGKMTERQFHDAVLGYGPIPVEFIRDGLLNLPLSRQTEAAWKFR